MKTLKFDTIDQCEWAREYFSDRTCFIDKVKKEVRVDATDEEISDFLMYVEFPSTFPGEE